MKTSLHLGLAFAFAAGAAHADTLALVAADSALSEAAVQQAMQNTGKFTSVTIIDVQTSTPDLATLKDYTDVLVWTVAAPADPVGLGNVLADYYDLGGKHLTIATYAFSTVPKVFPFFLPDPEIKGRITTSPYAALTNAGLIGDASGTLVETVSGDPVFSGIDLTNNSFFYVENSYFAQPGLAAGATLLATDGNGVNMIARSQNGVVDVNFYPGGTQGEVSGDNSGALFLLLANTFIPANGNPAAPPAPPVANPGGPYSFCPQSKPWLLDGSHSVDPEQGLSEPGKPPDQPQFGWDLNNTGKFTDASGAQPDVTAFYSTLGPGIYPAKLQVTASTAISFPGSGLANLTATASAQVLIKNSCSCITSLTAAPFGSGQVELTWPLTGSNHYNIYRGLASGGPYTFIGSTNSTTSQYFDATGVSGTTYYYIVREANLLNAETCQSNEVHAIPMVDTMPPTTTAAAAPAANGQGWNNTAVTVSLSAIDNQGGSGVKQISVILSGAQSGTQAIQGNTATVQITAEGSTTLTYSSTDNAGNVEASHILTVRIDETAPTATATASPLPDASGVNSTDVTVTFTGTDSLSGVASCTAPVTLTATGTATGTCTDNAGNVSKPVSKNITIHKTTSQDPTTGGPVINGVPASGACVLNQQDNRLVRVATLSVKPGDAVWFDVKGSSTEPPWDRDDLLILGFGLFPREVWARAERTSNPKGIVYTLTAKAVNKAGATTVDTFTCTVPPAGSTQASGNHDHH